MRSGLSTMIVVFFCLLLAATSMAASPASGSEAGRESKPADSTNPAPAVVDVNRAGIDELTSIPGIGPALARRIVEHRKAHGAFRKPEELLAVKGIGPRLLEKIRPRITTGAAENNR